MNKEKEFPRKYFDFLLTYKEGQDLLYETIIAHKLQVNVLNDHIIKLSCDLQDWEEGNCIDNSLDVREKELKEELRKI